MFEKTFLLPWSQNTAPFFANLSFLLLFLAMFFYWIDLVFFEGASAFSLAARASSTNSLHKSQEATSPVNLLFASLVDSLTSLRAKLGNFTIFAANLSLFVLLCVRWKESGHFPLSNLYESLMFLSWSCTSILIFTNFFILAAPAKSNEVKKQKSFVEETVMSIAGSTIGLESPQDSLPDKLSSSRDRMDSASSIVWGNTKGATNPDNAGGLSSLTDGRDLVKHKFLEKLLGSILAPCALFLNSFGTFSLPQEMQQAGPLVPALQSNWLMMHVTVMIISYAALMLGSLLSIAFLIFCKIALKPQQSSQLISNLPSSNLSTAPKDLLVNIKGLVVLPSLGSTKPKTMDWGGPEGPLTQGQDMQKAAKEEKSSALSLIAKNLDYLSYRIIGIGFPFLTIGILSGAVWANEAWGSYWSWDPKETWALLTWLVFAIYLHTRLTKGWEGEKPAYLAAFGFIVVWICFLGVNLLGQGLHSYGFFK